MPVFNLHDSRQLNAYKIISEKMLHDKKYTNLEYLGNGTFGIVYKGKNPQGKQVAIKIVFSEVDNTTLNSAAQDELNGIASAKALRPILQNFLNQLKKNSGNNLNECRINGQKVDFPEPTNKYLNVPVNIGEAEYKEITEYFPGFPQETIYKASIFESSLAVSDILQVQNISLSELKKIARNILKGLKFLHERHTIHLDIKPENILVLSKSNGKSLYQLTDFGLTQSAANKDSNAKVTDNTIAAITVSKTTGSPKYQAPEIRQNRYGSKKPTIGQLKAIDIYALGASLADLYCKKSNIDNNYFQEGNDSCAKLKPPHKIDEEFSTFSEDDRRFLKAISKMIDNDPNKRPSAEEALKLPGFAKSSSSDSENIILLGNK